MRSRSKQNESSRTTVTGERTWSELQGIACLEMTAPEARHSICTSRSFGERLTEKAPISEAVANFAAMCGEKLCHDHSCANTLLVFLHASPFDSLQETYYNQQLMQLPSPTNDSSELAYFAKQGIEKIYKKGLKHKKAGVIVMDIVPEKPLQLSLFDERDRDKHRRVMDTIDKINFTYGRHHIKLASQGYDRRWMLKNERLPPCYTTSIRDIIEVNAY